MSSQCWSEYGIGLVLTANHKIGGTDEISYVLQRAGFDEIYDFLESKENAENTWRFYDVEMEGKSFRSFTPGAEAVEPGEMLVVFAKKWMHPYKATYTPNELFDELKKAVGNLLPDSFDWEAHIGEFSCTIYC